MRLLLVLTLVIAPLVARAEVEPIGDPEAGARVWAKCSICHQLGPGAVSRIGPHLNEIFGRKAGVVEGFRYSKSLARAGADGLVWTEKTLDAYIENPRVLVSGTRMSFRGLKDAQDRHNLLAYLRDFTASPRDIPEAEPTAHASEVSLPPEVLALKGDPAWGEYLSSECTTCHQVDGTDSGIPSITQWPQENFVVAMHAYKQKLRPHPVMQMMAGRLADEEIAALAAYFAELE